MRCRRLPVACDRGRCCSATSSATSSTATASSSSSPNAGGDRRALDDSTALVVNGDDPQVGDLAHLRDDAVAYGLDDARQARPASSTLPTRAIASLRPPYEFAAAYVGHLGDYRCPACGHARPELQVVAREIELHGLDGASFDLVTPAGARASGCPSPVSTTSTTRVGAAALAQALGASLDEITPGSSASVQRSVASSGSPPATRRSSCC